MRRSRILVQRPRPGFNPNLVPGCDGRPLATVPRAEPWRAVKARFVAAYHQINECYARLVELRRQRPAPGPAAERSLLQAIESALLAKEALEDRWVSRGVVAVPQQSNGFTVNLQFSYPGGPRSRQPLSGSSATMTMAFRPPTRRARG